MRVTSKANENHNELNIFINQLKFIIMKQLTFTLILSIFSIFSFAQWATNGSDIYYNDGKVGIGTDSPDANFHIMDYNSGLSPHEGTTIFSETNWGNTINIISGTGHDGFLMFGDTDDHFRGAINYNHAPDWMIFYTDHQEQMRIHSNGDVELIQQNAGVILTSPNGTKYKITVDNSGNLTTIGYSGINSISTEIEVEVFPNPTKELLNINISDLSIKEIDAEIYNITGRMIYMKNYKSNSFQINTSELIKGTYLLKLKDNQGNLLKTEKIIK